MRIVKILIYFIALSTLFLPIFFIFSTEPSVNDLEHHRIIDSTTMADSLNSIKTNTKFDSQDRQYKNNLKSKVDSICDSNNIEICPSISCWTYNDLTGLGLLIRFFQNGLLFLIPLIFYFWIFICLIALVFNQIKLSKGFVIFGLLFESLMTLLIMIAFTFSIFYYALVVYLIINDIKRLKKLRQLTKA